MKPLKSYLEKIDRHTWQIAAHGKMRVPGKVYASPAMMNDILKNDACLQQVVNVAHLPGIMKYSLGMPDIHWGYGFPIGGVAATHIDDGVISPGGVGYDINCGVRLISTALIRDDIQARLPKLVESLYKTVPTGVGSSGAISELSADALRGVLKQGAGWAVNHGFGRAADLKRIEENGCLESADVELISSRAIERGRKQLGTLGSGNHFLEIDVVDQLFDADSARVMNLSLDQIVVLIHTGSRGCGHQICDDYLKILARKPQAYGYEIPDRQLACAPITSNEGKNYLAAMAAGANFAWANRQIIMALAEKAILKTLAISENELCFQLVYDVSHNIAKMEEHEIDGRLEKVCLHRKGATRAFPPNSPFIPECYRSIGQPVLIPGDMGRYSFVCVGSQKAMSETFGSTCHGAGRVLSRKKALRIAEGRDLFNEMKNMGVSIKARGRKTVAEEMPYAYKDVAGVVDVMHQSGVSSKVARLRPLGVIKG